VKNNKGLSRSGFLAHQKPLFEFVPEDCPLIGGFREASIERQIALFEFWFGALPPGKTRLNFLVRDVQVQTPVRDINADQITVLPSAASGEM
jgi:hypothetical protein